MRESLNGTTTRQAPPGSPKILFISHTGDVSGPTHSLLHLIRRLRFRYETGVVAPTHGFLSDSLGQLGVDFIALPDFTRKSIPAFYRIITGQSYDLVYGNTPDSGPRNALIAAKLARRPFVWHFRAIKDDWTWKQGVFVRWADRVVAVSEACARPLRRFRRHGDVLVAYNGIEPSDFAEDAAAARSRITCEFNLPPEATLVLTVSHVMPRKGIRLGLEAVGRLMNSADVYWLIAGALDRDLELVESVRASIAAQGLADRVRLLGLRGDMPQLMASADVLLHPALRDPHPRAVIEAMAAGLPVVAFDVDGLPETVLEGQTGFMAPSGDVDRLSDKLAELIGDRPKREAFGRAGKARAESRFNADQTAETILPVIEEVLG